MSKLPLERPSCEKKEKLSRSGSAVSSQCSNAETLATPYQFFAIKLEQERVRRHGGVPQE